MKHISDEQKDREQDREWVAKGGFFHRFNGMDHACMPLPNYRVRLAQPEASPTSAPVLAEVERLRDLAGACYAGLGAECDLPEAWLDVLAAAANGEPFSTEGLLPFVAQEPPAVQAPLGAPDIPPGCQMARGWAVEVSAHGERVLLLSDVGYCGLVDIEPWASTIRGCAENLQGFIGPAEGNAAFDPAPEPESLETGEGDAIEPPPCAAGCKYALDGRGLAPQCMRVCSKERKG